MGRPRKNTEPVKAAEVRLLEAKLTPEGVGDLALKAATVASSVIITKAILDGVQAVKWLKWVSDHPVTLEKAMMASLLLGPGTLLSPLGPVVVGAMPTQDDLTAAAQSFGREFTNNFQLVIHLATSTVSSIIPFVNHGQQPTTPEDSEIITPEAEAVKEAAYQRTLWAVAIMVGVLAAAALIYAGDTIIDLISDVLGKMQIPLPIAV